MFASCDAACEVPRAYFGAFRQLPLHGSATYGWAFDNGYRYAAEAQRRSRRHPSNSTPAVLCSRGPRAMERHRVII